MGLTRTVHWAAWFFTAFLHMQVTLLLLVLLIHFGNLLPQSNPLVLHMFFSIFCVAMICFWLVSQNFFLTCVVVVVASSPSSAAGFFSFLLILHLRAVECLFDCVCFISSTVQYRWPPTGNLGHTTFVGYLNVVLTLDVVQMGISFCFDVVR